MHQDIRQMSAIFQLTEFKMAGLMTVVILFTCVDMVVVRCPQLRIDPRSDQNKTIGSRLEINCTLKHFRKTNCSIDDVEIMHNNKVLQSNSISKKTRKFRIDKITSVEEEGDYICVLKYGCCRMDGTCCTPKQRAVNVQIGYNPQDYVISDETFVFENQQNLDITFRVTAPEEDSNMIRPQWTAEVSDAGKAPMKCKEKERHGRTVSYNCDQSFYDSRLGKKTITILGKSDLGNTSKNIEFEPNLHVKPARISGVAVTAAATSLQLTWNASVGEPSLHLSEVGNLTYTLTYQSKFDAECHTVKNVSCDTQRCKVNITALVPHTPYNLSITCKPNRGGYPSDPYMSVVWTNSAVPKTGPSFLPMSFSRVEGNAAVMIYPMEIPEGPSRGGDILDYVIVQYQHNDTSMPHRRTDNPCQSQISSQMKILQVFDASSEEGHSLQLNLSGLSASENIVLGVFATTTAGCSKTASHLRIGRLLDTELQGWVDAVKINGTHHQIWFEAKRDLTAPVSVGLHWCCSLAPNTAPPRCMNELKTGELGSFSSLGNFSITVSHSCGSAGAFPRFGMSLTRHNRTSGIIWDSCHFVSNGGSSPVQVDKVYYNSTQGAIEVIWGLACSHAGVKGRPLSYDISFQALGEGASSSPDLCDKGQRYQVRATHKKMEVLERNLAASRYSVCIREVTEAGSGPWSQYEVQTLSDVASGTTKLWLIAIGVLFVIAVISLAVCFRSRFSKYFKKIQENSYRVEFPEASHEYKEWLQPGLNDIDEGLQMLPEDSVHMVPDCNGKERAALKSDKMKAIQDRDSGCSSFRLSQDRGKEEGKKEEESQHSEDEEPCDGEEGEYGLMWQGDSKSKPDVDSGRDDQSKTVSASGHYFEGNRDPCDDHALEDSSGNPGRQPAVS